jgi:hypothetical protein
VSFTTNDEQGRHSIFVIGMSVISRAAHMQSLVDAENVGNTFQGVLGDCGDGAALPGLKRRAALKPEQAKLRCTRSKIADRHNQEIPERFPCLSVAARATSAARCSPVDHPGLSFISIPKLLHNV